MFKVICTTEMNKTGVGGGGMKDVLPPKGGHDREMSKSHWFRGTVQTGRMDGVHGKASGCDQAVIKQCTNHLPFSWKDVNIGVYETRRVEFCPHWCEVTVAKFTFTVSQHY